MKYKESTESLDSFILAIENSSRRPPLAAAATILIATAAERRCLMPLPLDDSPQLEIVVSPVESGPGESAAEAVSALSGGSAAAAAGAIGSHAG